MYKSGLYVLLGMTLVANQTLAQNAEQCSLTAKDAYQLIINGNAATQTHVVQKAESASNTININTASLLELMTLPNIGQKKAQAIIDYRTIHGAFNDIQQLTEIKGIGDKTLAKFSHLLTIK